MELHRNLKNLKSWFSHENIDKSTFLRKHTIIIDSIFVSCRIPDFIWPPCPTKEIWKVLYLGGFSLFLVVCGCTHRFSRLEQTGLRSDHLSLGRKLMIQIIQIIQLIQLIQIRQMIQMIHTIQMIQMILMIFF